MTSQPLMKQLDADHMNQWGNRWFPFLWSCEESRNLQKGSAFKWEYSLEQTCSALVEVMKTKGNGYSCNGINLEHEPWTLEPWLIHSHHDYFIHSFICKTYIYTCTDFMSSCDELRQLTSEVAKACLARNARHVCHACTFRAIMSLIWKRNHIQPMNVPKTSKSSLIVSC